MSMPTIPDINPDINICRDDAINILLASIGLEEMALAELMKAESKKLTEVLSCTRNPYEINELNKSVESLLKVLVTYETILQSKLRDVIELAQYDEIRELQHQEKNSRYCKSNKHDLDERRFSDYENESLCYCKSDRCNQNYMYSRTKENAKPFYSSFGYNNISIHTRGNHEPF